jgi:D-3-phosphoglycerate dehydrogenase
MECNEDAGVSCTPKGAEKTMNLCLMPQPIHASGVAILQNAGLQPLIGEEACALANPEQVVAGIFRSTRFDRAQMQRFQNLRVIGVHGAGVDNIDLAAARDFAIPVFNTPGLNARSVAEHAITLMFALSKQLLASDQAARAGNMAFRFHAQLRELQGLTLGLVGFGAIGRATGLLAVALGMHVQVFARSATEEQLGALGMRPADSLKALLTGSDIVSLHLPAVPLTFQLIGREQLSWMKPSALLINTGRAALVDEVALIDALQSGVIAGAALDVYAFDQMPGDYPLLQLPNVLLTPHTAGSTEQSLIRLATAVTQGVIHVLAGGEPQNRVV